MGSLPHPGAYLRDALDEHGYALDDLVQGSHIPLDMWRELLREERGLSVRMAEDIARIILPVWEGGESTTQESRTSFWMRLQAQWDESQRGGG